MLRQIRAAAKSWVVILLMGLLVISFAVWGVGDAFGARLGDSVVQAGSRRISPQQFATIFNNYKRGIEQQAQRPVALEEMVRYGVVEQVLRALSAEESFAEIMRRSGVTPSDQLVGQQIRQQEAFFDRVTGQFSQEQYLRLLADNEITPQDFEATLRDEVAQSHFASSLIAGMRAPRLYAATAAAAAGQVRTVSWFAIGVTAADQPPAPADADLQAFLRQNAARLRRPEFRQISLVRFSGEEIAASVPISPVEVQRQFEFRRDSLSTPERRSFVQIPVRDAAAGARVTQALRAGQDPAAVARSVSVDPVVYADQPRTAVVDPAVAAAAFALPAGAVSDLVRGELGLSVVRVTSVTPGVTATLESVRPQIEAAIRTSAAAERVSALVERYEQAHGGGATLPEAARAAGLTVTPLPPITAQGANSQGAPTGLPPQLLTTAFELPQGGESDVLQAGPNEYYAIRVERVIPPALPPLTEVREPLAQAWRARRLAESVEARANALAQRVRSGQPIAQVAASAGASLTTAPLPRPAAVQALGEQAAVRVFAARSGEVLVAAAPSAFYVARVERAAPPPADAAARAIEPARQALTLQMLREVGEIARRAAAAEVEPRTDPTRARQAIGADAATAAPASGSPS